MTCPAGAQEDFAGMPLLIRVSLHTLAIYLFLIAGLRLVGRRQLGQLTVIDLIIIIIMGSAVETAMVAANTSLAAGLVSAGTLLVANWSLTRVLGRSKRFRHLVHSGPLLLINYGHVIEDHLRRAGLTHADLLEVLREHEHVDSADVKFAVLEADGTISVLGMDVPTLRGSAPLTGLGGEAPQQVAAGSTG